MNFVELRVYLTVNVQYPNEWAIFGKKTVKKSLVSCLSNSQEEAVRSIRKMRFTVFFILHKNLN